MTASEQPREEAKVNTEMHSGAGGKRETKSECVILPECCNVARTRDKKFLMKRSRASMARTSSVPWVFGGNSSVKDKRTRAETDFTSYQVCLC